MVAGEFGGIAAAVVAFVMTRGNVAAHFQEANAGKLFQRRFERLGAVGGVRFHDLEFAIAQLAGLDKTVSGILTLPISCSGLVR